MNIRKFFLKISGIESLRRRERERQALLKQEGDRTSALLEAKIVEETKRQILGYPEKVFTAKKFASLPKGNNVNFQGCKIGTWFLCNPYRHLPGVVVVGQVVGGDDMFVDQWGAGLSIPERGINRYRVRLA